MVYQFSLMITAVSIRSKIITMVCADLCLRIRSNQKSVLEVLEVVSAVLVIWNSVIGLSKSHIGRFARTHSSV